MHKCPSCDKTTHSQRGLKHHFVAKHGGYSAWNAELRKIKKQEAKRQEEWNARHAEQIARQNLNKERHELWIKQEHILTGADLEDIMSEVSDLCDWLQPYYSQNVQGSLTPILDGLIERTLAMTNTPNLSNGVE